MRQSSLKKIFGAPRTPAKLDVDRNAHKKRPKKEPSERLATIQLQRDRQKSRKNNRDETPEERQAPCISNITESRNRLPAKYTAVDLFKYTTYLLL